MYISEPAEYAILGLLQSQPMHGYEMFQQFRNGILEEIVHLEMSQMYAFLKKLEHLKYIAAQLEAQGSRPPRKVFHLTPSGSNTFFQWLSEPVIRPREVRILFLIKLYFIQQFRPRQTASLVDQQIAACRHFLEHLESKHSLHGETNDGAFFEYVVLRGRIYQTRSLLDWLHELQDNLLKISSTSSMDV
ncbi:MAG: PadR family transcriptional regulator [Ktedonobacteraceae bacterium]